MRLRSLGILSILMILIATGRASAANSRQTLRSSVPLQHHPSPVQAVVALCRARPGTRESLWIRGWFVPSIQASGYFAGGLFASRRAVPAGVENGWDLNGRWKRYGALYTHITTQASFGERRLTLHGQVDCASFRFWSDRDPFPSPSLKPVYRVTERGPGSPATTTATAGGLQLTLTVPRRRYPRQALILVRMAIRNVSRHEVSYWTAGVALPGFASPQAEVLNGSGEVVFPPAMEFMPPLPGPPPFLQPLRPGQTVSYREYVVLRGTRLRGSQRFVPQPLRGVNLAANTLATRPVTLSLHQASAPGLSLRQAPAGPVLDMTRPPHLGGQPLVLAYANCGFPTSYHYSYTWVRSGLHLTPGCSPLQEWHVRVAWLNHPVAAFDYVAPHPHPILSPISTPSPITIRATRSVDGAGPHARFVRY